jgi:hypothetical protein
MRDRVALRALLAAVAIGISFAIVELFVTGVLAARAIPHWYISFLKAHKYVGLELWSIAEMQVPIALLAAGLGVVLARLVKNSSISPPLVALGAWLLCRLLLPGFYGVPLGESLRDQVSGFAYFPMSMTAEIVLPCLALILGFRWIAQRR